MTLLIHNNIQDQAKVLIESGLVTLVIKADNTGIFHMNEYGRDDKVILQKM